MNRSCLNELFVLILPPDRTCEESHMYVCIVGRSGLTKTKMKEYTLQTIICQLVFV